MPEVERKASVISASSFNFTSTSRQLHTLLRTTTSTDMDVDTLPQRPLLKKYGGKRPPNSDIRDLHSTVREATDSYYTELEIRPNAALWHYLSLAYPAKKVIPRMKKLYGLSDWKIPRMNRIKDPVPGVCGPWEKEVVDDIAEMISSRKNAFDRAWKELDEFREAIFRYRLRFDTDTWDGFCSLLQRKFGGRDEREDDEWPAIEAIIVQELEDGRLRSAYLDSITRLDEALDIAREIALGSVSMAAMPNGCSVMRRRPVRS